MARFLNLFANASFTSTLMVSVIRTQYPFVQYNPLLGIGTTLSARPSSVLSVFLHAMAARRSALFRTRLCFFFASQTLTRESHGRFKRRLHGGEFTWANEVMALQRTEFGRPSKGSLKPQPRERTTMQERVRLPMCMREPSSIWLCECRGLIPDG
jgi:hypothetical protein